MIVSIWTSFYLFLIISHVHLNLLYICMNIFPYDFNQVQLKQK